MSAWLYSNAVSQGGKLNTKQLDEYNIKYKRPCSNKRSVLFCTICTVASEFCQCCITHKCILVFATVCECCCKKVDPEDVNYSKVEYILVDPSCSGSGCLSHVDRALDKVIVLTPILFNS